MIRLSNKMVKASTGLEEKIKELKKKRNVVILVHNYQLPEVQDVADFRGDSLELSRIAAKTEAKVIVFCGVYFMAETASILSPEKLVIMPDKNAGCPMANMLTAADLRKLKSEHPQAAVVGYVNTSAEVKAELDYCCTSTNAVAVVNALKDKEEIISSMRFVSNGLISSENFKEGAGKDFASKVTEITDIHYDKKE